MINILKKFHLNISTYFFFLLSFFCGYFKQTIFIFLIVLFHECGHIFAISFCKYRFLKVEFFPFGGMTTIDKPINSSIRKEMFIAIFGVVFQLILFFLLFFLNSKNLLSLADYKLLQTYNVTILLFNCLPIIPLDGSVLLHSIFENFFSFETSYRFYEIVSWIFLIFFFLFNYYTHIDNYFICFVLITEFFMYRKNKKYIIHRFYLERMLREYPYRKIQNERFLNVHSMKKETRHFYLDKNRYLTEKEALQKYFLKSEAIASKKAYKIVDRDR